MRGKAPRRRALPQTAPPSTIDTKGIALTEARLRNEAILRIASAAALGDLNISQRQALEHAISLGEQIKRWLELAA
jgi:hypothetical protein